MIDKLTLYKYMIGNSYPYENTRWSIIEQGDLTNDFCLCVNSYLIVDPYGRTVHEVATIDEARQWLASHLTELSHLPN